VNPSTGAGLAELGKALASRSRDVVERMRSRMLAAGGAMDPGIEALVDDAARVSTIALGGWIAGSSTQEARDAGGAATRNFGQLAAQRAVSLNEVTKRCLRWRDVVMEVLHEEADRLGCGDPTRDEALSMSARSGDVTVVRMCEAFETERQRVHDEVMFHQAELTFQATHDKLTGLANRILVVDRVREAMYQASPGDRSIAALLIDLDNFNYVNNTYGHDAGDRLLAEVVNRLDDVIGSSALLGRLGGDEFVIVDTSLDGNAEQQARRVLEVLRRPFLLAGMGETPLTVTASIGIATGLRSDPEEILRHADVALYRAKRAGRDRYALYEPAMSAAIQRRVELERDLRDGVRHGQFFVMYQPVVDLDSLRTVGVEALVRWAHPTRGTVAPSEFIPLLEETGLITTVGRQVLSRACRDGANWHRAGYDLEIAVNVSARQLDSDDFLADIESALAESGLDPHKLVVELTETALMHDPDAATRQLTAISALGAKVAIDDFGTGYSSLDHLRRFPVDILKIDRCFIARMLRDSQGEALIHTLVRLGDALGVGTIAEGIENAEQLRLLRAHNCQRGQGFLFAHPLLAENLEQHLHASTSSSDSESSLGGRTHLASPTADETSPAAQSMS
jgi:diguanylate cyclase (GGDEF)-like protein